MSAKDPPSEIWLQKRKMTIIAFSYQFVLIGLEYGIQIANLWLYINQLVKTDHPKMFYGTIMLSYFLSIGLMSLPVSKYADRSRNIRIIFFICNAAKIIGNCMYTLYYSPWILVVSRVISGCGHTFRAVAIGEVARCFKPDEVMSKMSILAVSVSIGFMIAPAINTAFISVNIKIGSLHITFANISGIYIAVLFAIAEVITFFMIHDLSKEYDMKCNAEEEKEVIKMTRITDIEGTVVSSPTDKKDNDESLLLIEKEATMKEVVKQLLTHTDSCLLISLAFVESYMFANFNMWKSMLIIDTLKWSVTALYGFLCGAGFASTLPAIVVICKKFSNTQLFNISVFGIIAYAVIQMIFVVLTIYNENKMLNILLIVIMAFLYSFMMIIRAVFLIGFFTQMVSSKYQSFAQSFRLLAELAGTCFGVLTAAFQFEWIKIVGPLYICVLIIFLILLINRRKSFSNLSVII